MLFKRWLAITIFVASFLGGSLANLPLSLFLGESRLGQSGLAAAAISGTIWRGEIKGLRLGPHRIGDVQLEANPLFLFRLGYGGKAQITPGAAKGQGLFLLQSGPSLRLGNFAVIIDLAKLGYRDPNGRPVRGQLSLDLSGLHLRQQQGEIFCNSLEGYVGSDALSVLGKYYDKELPILRGVLGCEKGRILLAIAGENEIASIDISAEISANFDYTANITIETADREIQSLLILYGFNFVDNHYTLIERSNLAEGWR